MQIHSDNFFVLTAATACLYNQTKLELSLYIHSSVLEKVVEATLFAMENFTSIAQIQSNALLILCNGHILLVCTSNFLILFIYLLFLSLVRKKCIVFVKLTF